MNTLLFKELLQEILNCRVHDDDFMLNIDEMCYFQMRKEYFAAELHKANQRLWDMCNTQST